MALLTIAAKVALVDIFVAAIAVVEFQSGKNLEGFPVKDCFFVTSGTIGLLMLPFEWEKRLVVVKFFCRCECRCGMALCTLCTG